MTLLTRQQQRDADRIMDSSTLAEEIAGALSKMLTANGWGKKKGFPPFETLPYVKEIFMPLIENFANALVEACTAEERLEEALWWRNRSEHDAELCDARIAELVDNTDAPSAYATIARMESLVEALAKMPCQSVRSNNYDCLCVSLMCPPCQARQVVKERGT